MSENSEKTVFPGANPRGNNARSMGGFAPNQSRNFGPTPFETGNPSPSRNHNGTVVPGMDKVGGASDARSFVAPGNKPVLGFLYSVSRTPFGEFWPLHLGENLIGRGEDCAVRLEEASVSSKHAVIMLRKMKNPEKLIASIRDSSSLCGTMLNGQSLEFDPVECKSMDTIVFGENYECLLILIDAKLYNLSPSENFQSTAEIEDDDEPVQHEDVIHSYSPSDFGGAGFSSRISNPVNGDRTVAMGGGAPSAGGTRTR